MHGKFDEFGRFADPSVLILTSLAEGPKHGYAIMTDIAGFSGVSMEPGTLYGALARLERQGWITPMATEARRRPYEITASGQAVLTQQVSTMQQIVQVARLRTATAGRVMRPGPAARLSPLPGRLAPAALAGDVTARRCSRSLTSTTRPPGPWRAAGGQRRQRAPGPGLADQADLAGPAAPGGADIGRSRRPARAETGPGRLRDVAGQLTGTQPPMRTCFQRRSRPARPSWSPRSGGPSTARTWCGTSPT